MPRLVAIVFAFGLMSASAAQAAPRGADAPERASDNPDKVVCKRFARTGSLADSYRTCKTKKEWERERDNVRVINWASPCKSAESGTCE